MPLLRSHYWKVLKIFFFILTQYVVLIHSQSSLESESHSFQLLSTPWIYSPWNSPGQNTGVGSRSLLQGTFPTQGSNPGLLHCMWILWKTSWATREAPSSPANLRSIKVAGALFLGLYLFKFSKIKNVKELLLCKRTGKDKPQTGGKYLKQTHLISGCSPKYKRILKTQWESNLIFFQTFYFVLGYTWLTMFWWFRCIAKGLSHTYTCIHSPPNLPPIQAGTF